MTANRIQSTILNGPAQRRFALPAGICLLVMTIAIAIGEGLVMTSVLDKSSAAVTIENIRAREGFFRLGIFCDFLVIILDLIVAWAFYEYLKPLGKPLSLLAAWCRLIYSVIFAAALVNYFHLVRLLGGRGYASALGSQELQTQALLLVKGFQNTWDVGYVFFGLHLAFLGWVLFSSGVFPKWLGGLVLAGGVSYLVDYSSLILFAVSPNISVVFGFGELVFAIWLLVRGGKEVPNKALKDDPMENNKGCGDDT